MKLPRYAAVKANIRQLLRHNIWLHKKTVIFFALATGLLIFSAVGIWHAYRTTHSPNPIPSAAKVVTVSLPEPDETAIDTADPYDVPAGQPRKIMLPTIEAEGFMQPVNVDQHGAVAVPTNVHMAGWYTGEALPGANGLSVIDGHVQGRYTPGIFKNLSKLQPGARFKIELGDGSIRQFEVVSVKSYGVDEVSKYLFEKHADIPAQVNLITCGGKYNVQNRQYDGRILVVSKLITG